VDSGESAQSPGPAGEGKQPAAPVGIALIVLLTPLGLVASFLDAMARFPLGAAVSASVPGVIMAIRGDDSEAVITVALVAVWMALIPAAIRRALLW
jgi:hypothetical protein